MLSFALVDQHEKMWMKENLLRALHCWGEKWMYGKKYWGVEGSRWRKVNPPEHAKEVLESLKTLL